MSDPFGFIIKHIVAQNRAQEIDEAINAEVIFAMLTAWLNNQHVTLGLSVDDIAKNISTDTVGSIWDMMGTSTKNQPDSAKQYLADIIIIKAKATIIQLLEAEAARKLDKANDPTGGETPEGKGGCSCPECAPQP